MSALVRFTLTRRFVADQPGEPLSEDVKNRVRDIVEARMRLELFAPFGHGTDEWRDGVFPPRPRCQSGCVVRAETC